MSAIIGIDLGTTYSVAAYMTADGPRLIPNALGENLTPSVVGIDLDGKLLVGRGGKRTPRHAPRPLRQPLQALHGQRLDDRTGRPDLHARKALEPRAAVDQAGRRGALGRAGDRGRHHRAGLLPRTPAEVDDPRRADCRPEGRSGSSTSRRRRPSPTASTN